MKKLITIASLILSTQLCAQDSIISIGGNYTRSHIDPSGLSDFDGNMGGVQAMYQYRPLCCPYAAIGGYFRTGKNSGSVGVRDLTDAGAHARIGYTFAWCCCDLLFTPYTGFGYRHLSHHVKPKDGSKIKLRYNEFFIPIGFQSSYDIYTCLSIGLDAVWMGQVFPTVTFDVVDDARWVIESTYKNFKVGLPLYYHIQCPCLSIQFMPFFEFWQDGKTTGKTQFNDPLGLPKTTYKFWGVEVNLQYAF